MLKTLKALLRRVDFYLRNEPYSPPSDDFKLYSFEDIFEKPEKDPLRTRVYWAIVRFWTNHWICNPRSVYYECVYAYQRLTRGWDDRACWSVDYWLDAMMPDILRKLKKDKHGIPASMFYDLPVNDQGYHDESEMKVAEARWDAVMDKIIAGFEASHRTKEGLYEDELGEYPLRRPEGVTKEEWDKISNDRYAASRKLTERDEKIFKEGMEEFVKNYWSLWD